MARFSFTARDASGRPRQGALEAGSPSMAATDLRERGWIVVQLRADEAEPASTREATKPRQSWRRASSSDVEVGLRQLAVMLRSGLTLLDALETVAEQAPRASMQRIWQDVSQRIQQGASLAEAMQQHSQFSQLVVQLVRVGEQTGYLEVVLSRGARTLEDRRKLRGQLLSALAYPGVVFVAAIGVTFFMMFSVIPKLQTFLSALGRKLPFMTQLVIDIADFLNAHVLHGVLLIAACTAVFIALRFWPPGRMWMDRYALRIPVLGALFRLSGTVLVANGLGTLLRSGVTLLEGLRTTERLLGNRYLASQIAHARETVMQGGSLAEPLRTRHAFMPMLASMVSVGEQAGTLDEVLDEVARFHEDQLQRAIRRLAAFVEPAIILVVGGIVGFVYISFFMALFAAAGG